MAALPGKQLSDCICAQPLVCCAHGGVTAPTHLCEIYENKAYAWKASEAGLEERCCRASALRCDMVCGPCCMQVSMSHCVCRVNGVLSAQDRIFDSVVLSTFAFLRGSCNVTW